VDNKKCFDTVDARCKHEDYNEISTISKDFRKIFKYKIPQNSVQWDPSFSMRMERHDEVVTLRNFENAPKSESDVT
jgi:hypothetical protein